MKEDAILYFNGDSHVAGVELADDIIPGWPGLYHEEDYKLFQKNLIWRNNFFTSSLNPEVRKQIEKLERSRSFPIKLAKKLKLDFIDSSLGGASFDRIVRTSIVDLINLKKSNNNIIAIIGLTGIGRFEVGNKNTDWMSILLVNQYVDYNLEKLKEIMAIYETDYHRLVKFYLNYIQLKDFCTVNNIKLHIVCPKFPDKQTMPVYWSDEHEDINSLRLYSELKESADMHYISLNINDYKYSSCGHYSVHVHDAVAEHLYKEISIN